MSGASKHLGKARNCLISGRYLLDGGFADQAGRDAYMAAFHAAQALIVSRTGRAAKTHHGTHSEFARLVRTETAIAHDLVAFLSQSYGLKSFADYDDGQPVTMEEAQASLARAARFVDAIAALVPPP